MHVGRAHAATPLTGYIITLRFGLYSLESTELVGLAGSAHAANRVVCVDLYKCLRMWSCKRALKKGLCRLSATKTHFIGGNTSETYQQGTYTTTIRYSTASLETRRGNY